MKRRPASKKVMVFTACRCRSYTSDNAPDRVSYLEKKKKRREEKKRSKKSHW
jgi:hypothetical protein